LLSLWRNVIVEDDLVHDIVTTSSRSDITMDVEEAVELTRLLDTFGQEDLLDAFSDEEENTSNGQAYEDFLSLELGNA